MEMARHAREEQAKIAGVGAFDYSNPNLSASDVAMRMSALRQIEPRPILKLWHDPSTAEPGRVEEQMAKIKQWKSEYRKASKLQKQYLERDNAAFYARQGK